MANIKDFIKKIGNESVSLEEQQQALAQVEKTIVAAKAKREESIGKNVDLVISALKNIEAKLETKLVELNNTPAKQGIQGPQGPAGRDGRDGVDGYKGQDGKDGVDGKDGKDGENGISVTDAQIDFDGSLLITLSDGREIDAGTVIPLDVAKQIHSVSTNGGGTSQSVLDAIDAINATIATYGTMATQNANAVAVTGGTINNATIGATTPTTGKFTTLEATGTSSLGTASAQYIQVEGNALYPQVKAVGSGTNIPLVLQPKGTGALQAQFTDSTTTGGNARGANAVDWQTSRGSASQVASAQYSVVGGGTGNTASSFGASTFGGSTNNNSGTFASILGGASNSASGTWSAIAGGASNTTAGTYNFIGGGFTNSGTANAAVTTQSATMNATTAVTLSGSNASIKVGQYITGTSIGNNTYVAAISGTSLTLSQAASGSSTSTLSFYTPHGVVVGGGNNQATGSYSFIGGGGDAGTAANRNVASGDWSFVGGGAKNVVSGVGAFIGGGGVNSAGTASGNTVTVAGASIVGGNGNSCTGIYSFVGGGQANAISQQYSTIAGGYNQTANGQFSSVNGGSWGTTRSITGNQVLPACFQPIAGVTGVSQTALLVLARQTTDATATVLTSDSSAASTTNQVIMPNNSAYYFKGTVIAGKTAAGDTKGWTIEGVIKRGANAASTAIVGTATVTSLYADAGAATWTVTALADTTNGGLKITVTGQAATTIRWVAKLETTELTY